MKILDNHWIKMIELIKSCDDFGKKNNICVNQYLENNLNSGDRINNFGYILDELVIFLDFN